MKKILFLDCHIDDLYHKGDIGEIFGETENRIYWGEGDDDYFRKLKGSHLFTVIYDDEYVESLQSKIEKAKTAIFESASHDGGHHKMWCLDQVIRTLTGDNYKEWVDEFESCDNCSGGTSEGAAQCPDCGGEGKAYEWEEGIAP